MFYHHRWPQDRGVWLNYGCAHGSYWLFRTRWRWLIRRAGFKTPPREVAAIPSLWIDWLFNG